MTGSGRLALAALAGMLVAAGPVASNPPDDLTFRPTLLVRRGNAAGTGTVIASVPGETLILTAAHVVAGEEGAPAVEVHRFNLGLERRRAPDGWPVRLPAAVVAADPAGDVAILRVVGKEAMPYVARVAPPGSEARRGSVVTSVGIDGGDHLSGWSARVVEAARFVMDPSRPGGRGSGSGRDVSRRSSAPASPRRSPAPSSSSASTPERPFLLTTRAPRQGRSGGGLFDEDGALVGVCVGRVEGERDRGLGVFASVESVHALLRAHDLEGTLARSDAFRTAGQSPRAGAADVVNRAPGHHNTSKPDEPTSAPPRAEHARGGNPPARRP